MPRYIVLINPHFWSGDHSITFAMQPAINSHLTNVLSNFNDVRKGMGLKEERIFKNHISLKKVSDQREQYVAGQLFELGDKVLIRETNQEATITVLGSNYVIVDNQGHRERKWLTAIQPIQEKKLTPNELKKRETVAKAIHKDDPNMPMDKKMAIATATAKRVAESDDELEEKKRKIDILNTLLKLFFNTNITKEDLKNSLIKSFS